MDIQQTHNFTRGLAIFQNKLEAASDASTDSTYKEVIERSFEHYKDSVGVMALGAGVFAAARLADTIIKLLETKVRAFDHEVWCKLVEETYAESYNTTPTSTPEIKKPVAKLIASKHYFAKSDGQIDPSKLGHADILDVNSPEAIAKRLQMIEIAKGDVLIEDHNGTQLERIDLFDDMYDEDLGVEGLRRRGIIAADYDSTSGNEPIILKKVSVKPILGQVGFREDGSIEWVQCPNCQARDVYNIGYEEYGCFSCGKDFHVEIPDELPEVAEAE